MCCVNILLTASTSWCFPPFSLLEPHSCGEPQRAADAPPNITRRMHAREAWPPHGAPPQTLVLGFGSGFSARGVLEWAFSTGREFVPTLRSFGAVCPVDHPTPQSPPADPTFRWNPLGPA
eukprot:1193308-Prorocentrum_minimum.AAC.1